MIFVTVGNAHNPFLRLLNAVEEMAAAGEFSGEQVLIQSGNNPDFKPAYCENRPFLSMDEFNQKLREASVVICHAGAGTLSSVLRTGKTPVVVPRRLKYNEHVDDHQTELLGVFAARGLLVPAYEVTDLPGAIRDARSRAPVSVEFADKGVQAVGQAIKEMLGS